MSALIGAAPWVEEKTKASEVNDVNLGWRPKAGELLWNPDLQQPKRSENGSWDVLLPHRFEGAATSPP
ncbi:hypothetical protein [Actinoplanes sp. NPDC049265]|uniref:hypothetical protein n=1 Tax=Actinoplanes sp. NPDC049265 TaxID=3363902 RepID=UPI00371D9A10